MAFKYFPLNGVAENGLYINTDHIIEFRVINTNGQYMVRAVVGIGTQYFVNLPGSPFATEALAITAMQNYITTITS
jgi:hypothetical protein